jgi:hypothetical protein
MWNKLPELPRVPTSFARANHRRANHRCRAAHRVYDARTGKIVERRVELGEKPACPGDAYGKREHEA